MRKLFTIALLAVVAPARAADVPKDVCDRTVVATFRVENAADDQTGSGVLIGRDGPHAYVLTAQHVVPAARFVDVKFNGGKRLKAEVLARSADLDLAVLRLAAVDGLPKPMQLTKPGVKPNAVVSGGWEKAETPTVLAERLKDKVRLKRPGETASVWCWEVERKPAAGRSGGPLVDETGTVVGVAIGHDGATGYFVHSDEVHTFLRQNGLKWLTENER